MLVLALLACTPYLLRRLQARRLGASGMVDGEASKLLSTVVVGPQQRVVTLEVGPHGARTWLVLGVTGQSINCLHVLPAMRVKRLTRLTQRRTPSMSEVLSKRGQAWLGALVALGLSAVAPSVFAQATGQGGQLPLVIGTGAGGTSYSVPVQTLLFFTALSFLPAILLMMTGFTRIVIVLSLLRQALGTQSAPPNQVVVGLSLFLTFFVMGPTIDRVYTEAYVPYTNNTLQFEAALGKAEAPMREFMLKQTRQSDFALFARLPNCPPTSRQKPRRSAC